MSSGFFFNSLKPSEKEKKLEILFKNSVIAEPYWEKNQKILLCLKKQKIFVFLLLKT